MRTTYLAARAPSSVCYYFVLIKPSFNVVSHWCRASALIRGELSQWGNVDSQSSEKHNKQPELTQSFTWDDAVWARDEVCLGLHTTPDELNAISYCNPGLSMGSIPHGLWLTSWLQFPFELILNRCQQREHSFSPGFTSLSCCCSFAHYCSLKTTAAGGNQQHPAGPRRKQAT